MIRLVPILAIALATCIPVPGGATPPAHAVPPRETGGAPLALERRAQSAEPERKAELLRLAAQRWLARGERRRAILALDAAILATPGDARLWRERASLYAATGAPRTAIYDLGQAMELEAASPADYRLRASLWRRIGAHDRAAADLAMAAQAMAPATTAAAVSAPPPQTVHADQTATPSDTPDALDALTIRTAQLPAAPAIAAPRSLLPATPAQAAGGQTRPADDIAARPARSALLASPALDDVTLSAARRQTSAGPAPAHFASSQPLFPPSGQRRDGVPAAPDPMEAHRRRMEAAAIVERRLEAGDAMTTAISAAPAGGTPDPNFRASTAPLPRIYRGGQIPAQMAGRVAITRGAATASARSTGPTGSTGIGGPLLPARKPAPVSFDATPADPMIERGVSAPVVAVQRGALR